MVPLLLLACASDNALREKDAAPVAFDTGKPPALDTDTGSESALPEDCNGVDDDGDGAVDEGFPDEDGNGRADCADSECPALTVGVAGDEAIDPDCEGEGLPTVTDPWNITRETYAMPYGPSASIEIGNLTDDDGDGDVDTDDVPDVAFTTSSGHLLVVAGDGSGTIFERSGMLGFSGTAVADVNADGAPEVVAVGSDQHVMAFSGAGDVVWASDTRVSTYPEMTVGDLDADGLPEVVVDDTVLNGEDGTFVTTLAAGYAYGRAPVIADVDQDGTEEILLGASLFAGDGTLLWDHTGDGFGAWAGYANVDADDEAEIVVIGSGAATVYEADGTERNSWGIDAPYGYAAPPCVGDFDGDASPEVGIPQASHMSVYEFDGTELWSAPTQDISGAAPCSGYDFDGDGALEVLYADEETFWIFDGATGAVRYEDPDRRSYTSYEYPLVVDLDGDGAAEVVVPEMLDAPGLHVYRQSDRQWPRSGSTWALHDFAVTNIEPDGGVPTSPVAPWLAYNVFRARPSVDDPPRPNLGVSITDVCVADCTYGPAAVAVQVRNVGAFDAPAGLSLALYALDDTGERLVATTTLPAVPAGRSLDGVTFELGAEGVGPRGYRAVVDDDGTGYGPLIECDERDNDDSWNDTFCP